MRYGAKSCATKSLKDFAQLDRVARRVLAEESRAVCARLADLIPTLDIPEKTSLIGNLFD